MGTLFRYELKKLLSRKLTWLLLALCAAFLIFINWNTLEEGWTGRARGFRDVYGLYEGQAVTEAFKDDVENDFAEYIAAHPDHFDAAEPGEDGSVTWFPNDWDYYSGVWQAYQDISNHDSVEARQERIESAKTWLASGEYENGVKVNDSDRRHYGDMIRAGVTVPYIHYAQAWRNLISTDTPLPAVLTFFVLGLAILSLFAGEGSSRMESVLLCAAGRRKAAFARMLAAFGFACAVAVLFFGMEIVFALISYGAGGAPLSLAEIEGYGSGAGMPAGLAFGLYMLSVAIIAASIAALVALASALFRHPVPALLLAAAFIFVQFLPSMFFDWYSAWRVQQPLISWETAYYDYAVRMPAMLLMNRYHAVSSVSSTQFMHLAFGLPALIIALCLWLAPRRFLKRRKA